MKLPEKFKLSLEQKKSFSGYIFTLPLILGFLLFFLYPFIQSIIFSVNQLDIVNGAVEFNFVGLENYIYALTEHVDYPQLLTITITQMISEVPLILIFSFFAAVLINQKFKGRFFARMIFFLPVVMSTGIILRLESNNFMMELMEFGMEEEATITTALKPILLNMRLPESLIDYVLMAIDHLPDIVRSSGIQILIFLAGLQSIPSTLYEASRVEGASGWENFWLITLPMLSPLILTNIVYTIIDFLTAGDNQLIYLIQDVAVSGKGYGASSAMSWIYFILIAVIISILIGLVSRWVFYHE